MQRGTRYYAVLDAGTTAIKALIFDASLNVVSRVAQKIGKSFPKDSWVEQDPEEIVRVSTDVLREAVREAKISAQEIESLGITNQRETVVCWDSTTSKAVYPAIVWEDTRTASACRALWWRGKSPMIRNKTGLVLDPYFTASKISWVLHHVPQAQELAHEKFLRSGTIDTWLLWNLSENHEYKTDYTNASRTLLFNIHSLTWDSELYKLFKIPEGLMAAVVPSKGDYGHLNTAILGARIPIRAICGDQQASMYAGGTAPFTTKVTYGTGAFLMQIVGEAPLFHKGFFTTLSPGLGSKPVYALEAKVNRCGERVTPAIGDEDELKKVFTEIAKEVDAHIKKLPYVPSHIIVDGGATRNKNLAKIQSKISEIPVIEQSIFDGTALGIAMLLRQG